MKKPVSEPLGIVRRAKAAMRFGQVAAVLLFLASVFFFVSRRSREAWLLTALTAFTLMIWTLPTTHIYRRRWKQQHVAAGFGAYAEQVELDENPDMLPEQFELLCLFPLDTQAMSAFEVRREVRMICHDRMVRVREMTVPARIRGLEAMVEGCLIQMDMPRAPMTRLILTGAAFGNQDTLVAWYRKNLRLLPTLYSVQQRMRGFGDGSEPDRRTLEQLRRITAERPQNMIVSLAGREISVFIRKTSLLKEAPMGPGRITEERLRQLAVPELSPILDFAFDMEGLRAWEDVEDDDAEERKWAGVRPAMRDEDFRRPEGDA